MNAHRVNQGQLPRWDPTSAPTSTDFHFLEVAEPAEAVERVRRLVQEQIPRRFGFDPLEDIQVLTPMQRGELGARNLNQVLQAALSPSGKQVQRFGWTFRVGDKVMQIINDYDKDVFNGDIGRRQNARYGTLRGTVLLSRSAPAHPHTRGEHSSGTRRILCRERLRTCELHVAGALVMISLAISSSALCGSSGCQSSPTLVIST